MTKKLESLFDLPDSEPDSTDSMHTLTAEQAHTAIAGINLAIDKIDDALPAVRGLDSTDSEMDELATLAQGSYTDLMELGMQVDSRFASEIFNVASSMLGHAITAKTAKLDKKLKMVDLQMKKMRLDQQQQQIDQKNTPDDDPTIATAEGHVLDRNELLDRLLGDRRQNSKKE